MESVPFQRSCSEEEPLSLLPELDEEDWRLFRKTLKLGKAKTNHVRVNIVGNQGAGKTTLVKRLQEVEVVCPDRNVRPTENLAVNQISTKCTERDGQRIWETNTQGYENESNLQRMAFALQSVTEKKSIEDSPGPLEVSELELGSEELPEHTDIETTMQYGLHIENQLKELYLKRVKRWQQNNSGPERMYISFWDFAGQATYYSTHQAFLAPSAVYVLVINLSQDLKSEMKDSLLFRTGILRKYTVEETVKFWISSIKAYTRDEKGAHAPFIVVGTHKDEVSEEKIGEKFKYLRSIMKKVAPLEFVAVDNTKPLSGNEALQDLRNKILDVGLGVIDKEISAQWIDLESSLLQEKIKGTTMMYFEDLEKLDAKSDMPIKDGKKLLDFLDYQHSRGWLLHFCRIGLENVIFLDPSLLVDFFNILLRDRGKELRSSCKNRNGIIHQDFVNEAAERVFSVQKDSSEVHIFTTLLLQLHIMHEYKEKKFFVPCLLPHRALVYSEPEHLCKDSQTFKMKLSFKDAFVPPAFYHLMVCALNERKELNIYKGDSDYKLYNQYVCFTFQRETLWLETYWSDSSIFFQLTNYSPINKMVDLENNKIVEVIAVVEEQVKHVLGVFRQSGTKYILTAECPKHSSKFVDLGRARKAGEVMCANKDTPGRNHAVLWKDLIQTKQSQESVLPTHRKPTEKMIGRLARQLSRENARSMTSKLRMIDAIADQALHEFSYSVNMQRLLVLTKWMERNPDTPLESLLRKFTRTGGYDLLSLEEHLTMDINFVGASSLQACQISDRELYLVSDCVGVDYPFLMLELGISLAEVFRSRSEHSDLRETAFQLLRGWQTRNAGNATLSQILQVLKSIDMGYADVISKLEGCE